MRIVPSLSQVVAGRIRLVGAMPRSVDEAITIPEFWKPILFAEPTGLIFETLAQTGPAATSDESSTGDVWFAMTRQPFKTVRLLIRYLKALLSGPLAIRKAAARAVTTLPARKLKEIPRDCTSREVAVSCTLESDYVQC